MTKKIILTIFAVGFLLCLALSAINFKNYLQIESNRALLDKQGVTTDAKVFKKSVKYDDSVSALRGSALERTPYSNDYFLYLRYDANSDKGTLSFTKALRGQKQDFDLSVNKKTFMLGVGESSFNRTELGDTLPIKYVPPSSSSSSQAASNTMIVEVLNKQGEYHSNYRLLYAVLLFLAAILIIILMRQYHTTGTTW